MIYCQGYAISFQEVPDEITLTILIADCPFRCEGCHSPRLQAREGLNLEENIAKIIGEYSDVITCVCFMGDGRDQETLLRCADYARDLGLKTAIYSGYTDAWSRYWPHFDYYKCGQYIAELGGLDSPNTNQFMLMVVPSDESADVLNLIDITDRFWKNKAVVANG